MNIEPGRWYKTRGGRKACIKYTNSGIYPYRGYVDGHIEYTVTWDNAGNQFSGAVSENDIVDYWNEGAEMNIEAGKWYKLANGWKAKVSEKVAQPLGENYFVGYRINVCGYACSMAWNENGDSSEITLKDYNIVSEWHEPPVVKWDELPPWIVAVAKEADGTERGFYDAKDIEECERVWVSRTRWATGCFSIYQLLKRGTIQFDGDWRDSLCIRPGHEGK